MSPPHVVMIDNYDSFTWNLYEYLCQEGARVDVFRNDKITLEELEKLDPDTIVISPGPGHPITDAGICPEVVKHFKGKKPIFGICMGQECIYSVFGGDVKYAGEIVHGKTSPITHDNRGMFRNVPQGVAVTRYHSLAGSKESLPAELEVTASTESGVIMGVRHREYTIEGVQFHPESILTEEGHLMIKNILGVKGGYWKDNVATKSSTNGKTSILNKIYDQRVKDYDVIMAQPGKSFEQLQKCVDLGLAPALIDFKERLLVNISKGNASVLSEIKRASPSKGDIQPDVVAPEQALKYARGGCAAISVLTEPHWFKGSLDDLKLARTAIDSIPNRPAVLRKEFIFNEYQILEARLAGADTVLLIVKMLSLDELTKLYKFSKSLGMEPLVEINSASELELALKVDAQVIGVNNRNLHDFDVDLNTTSKMKQLLKESKNDVIVVALSGISSVEDAKMYKKDDVAAFLIGEALMRAGDNAGKFIQELTEA
ncbi:unnamed protein product [Kuraishia capsulata CBS 1993]|uniref:Multifunctional tryptophan biosynthesis protein n=1 Tax=Kuraishia capsulata CBS 1993 TaxID=1382522 RepID=W6MR20_9ASCO|nr:uncharacterized protein KUCA_T00004783001 [Kuraishia capsulata CBS 1993]CDK28798.1 unnamed protein product [Kuraishia capsulata CBS 1993]